MSETILMSQEQLQKLVAGVMQGATAAQAAGVSQETLESLYSLAHNAYNSGSFRDAQTVFQALTLYCPHEYRFWLGLAGSRQAQKQYEAAIDAYQMAAVAGLLKNPEPFLYASRCLLQLGRKDDAVVALSMMLSIGSDADPRNAECHSKAKALLNLLKKA